MVSSFLNKWGRTMGHQLPTYMVVGVSGVTLLDLTGTIATAVPDARVIAAKSFSEAAELARGVVRLAGIIVRAGVQELQKSELVEILQNAQSQIVLVGEAAEDQAENSPYIVLHRPFGIDDVLKALNLPT
jgi:hypothetical protein